MQHDYKILLEKLNDFIKTYYKNLILRGIIYSIIGLISILILFAIIEHFGFFNSSTRTVFFWTYCVIALSVIIKLIIIPSFQMFRLTDSLSHEQAAQIIGEHFDEVSDKLINILELHGLQDGNSALIEASINQKINKIKLTPFNRAVDWGETLYYARFLIVPVIIILLFFISGNQQIIADSTIRIINYNQEFIKPAPFYFEIESDSLFAVEKENKTINILISGDERPNEVYIHYDNVVKKMKKLTNSKHSYTFRGIRKNTNFFLSANEQHSNQYEIVVIERPEITNLVITIKPPKHTGLNKEILTNVGSINVPEGSLLTWNIETKEADTLKFQLNQATFLLSSYLNNNFSLTKTIRSNSRYAISLANSKISFIDTVYYDIKVVVDSHPFISINKTEDLTNESIITGVIQDDYGFFDLQFIGNIYGLARDTSWQQEINIDPLIRSQTFLQSLEEIKNIALPGETINCYFIVRDNDKQNGYKSMTSEIITINMPTHEEIKEDYVENNTFVKNDITEEISMLNELKKELAEFEKSLIEKDSLDWRDRKKLEEIIQKQTNVEQKIEELKNATKNNFDKINSLSPPSEDMLKKQTELERLFDEIMPDEIKELYRELNDLKDQLSKNDLQEKLKELQLSNEDIEKELDRNLEILKQVEFEQQLEDLITQLQNLSKNQMELAKDENNLETKILSQKESVEQFKKIQKEIEKLKSLNKNLENKHDITDTDLKEEEILDDLNMGQELLEKNNKKRASKSQKEAAEKLEELANFFTNMKKENEKNKNYEDMDVLREILENLVYFSIEEESLLLQFQDLDKNDPKYVELMHEQQALRDAAEIIEDSLFALSKRVPQISSKINREINSIDRKTESTIDYLRERLTLKAVQDQQFIMTAANNLAVLLSGILESMQQEMANDLPSEQQCEKPGKGSPKPGDLQKMQQELQEHLEKMKKELEDGKQGESQQIGVSKRLVEMLAKQELIRQSLEELRKEMESADGLKALDDAIKQMEQNEEDIANKQITMESLVRQKQILTRLIEVEKAIREQNEDDERESKTATNEYDRIVQDAYEKYELEKLKQTEMIKTTPPSLNNYYKEKVDRYFNLMIQ